jgi:putative peptidoglycan lipid II flippase
MLSMQWMKRTASLGALSALNLLLTVIFQFYIVASLGPGRMTDAFFAATIVPNVLVSIVTGSLTQALVPLLAGEDPGRQRADVWTLAIVVLGTFLPLSALLLATAYWWIPVLQPGFDQPSSLLALQVVKVSLISMIFTAFCGVQTALYSARGLFVRVELSTLAANGVALVSLVLLLPLYGVVGAAFANMIRAALQSVLLIPQLGRPVAPDLKSGTVKQVWGRIKPLMVGAGYYKLEPVLDRFLLSLAPAGVLSLYLMGQQIFAAGSQILQKTIAAPLITQLTKSSKQFDLTTFSKLYRKNLLTVVVLSLAGLTLLVVCGQQLLDLVIGHRQIDAEDVSTLWGIMLLLAGSFLGAAAGHISTAAFYATGDTRTPARIGIWTFTLYVPLKIFMFHQYGFAGLAVGASLFVLCNFLLQHATLRKTILKASS